MFGGGFGAGFVGIDDHATKERDAPLRPIDLEFPTFIPEFSYHPLTAKKSSQLLHRICHGRSFAETTSDDISTLNIKFTKDDSLSSFVPLAGFASRPLLYDDDLQAMLEEIGIGNEDAFREVLRLQPLPGRKKPRLAYARNLFASLEDMARYWDTSMDNYYTIPATSAKSHPTSNLTGSSVPVGPDADVEMKDAPETREVYKGYRVSNAESMNPGTRIAMTKNLLKMVMHKFNCRDHEPMPQPREKLVVRGVKFQSIQYHFCVSRVPQDMKQARARFVEGPLMAVHVRDELRFKTKSNLYAPEKTGFVGERFDFFREIGCMLILANQRARESKTRSSGSEKWWLTKPRWGGGPTRWGQLTPEVFEEDDPSWSPAERGLQAEKRKKQDEDKAKGLDAKFSAIEAKKLEIEDLLAHAEKTSPAALLPDLRPRKKKLRSMERPPGDDPASMKDGRRLMYTPPFRRRWYQEWQNLRPNTSIIDEKIISKRIGNEPESFDGFDDIYMVSSVNHHVCLIKMRVHAEYLEWLENGTEVSDTSDKEWRKDVLYVSRSGWTDMFNVEERKEFLIALWRVMCWLNRKHVPQAEYTKMEEKRSKSSD